MAGINLSQSFEVKPQKEKKEKIFDTGFIITFSLFLLVAAAGVGLKFYSSYLDKNIGALESVILEHTPALESEAVARVADFDMRQKFIAEKDAERIDTNQLFFQLESFMVPTNMLLYYEYNKQDRVVTYKMSTDTFRNIAEQIISLKSSGAFSDVKVDAIDRTKEGKIVFALKAYF